MTIIELSECFEAIKNAYSDKFKDLRVNISDSFYHAEYTIVFYWKNQNDTKYFKSKLPYGLLESKEVINAIVEHSTSILDKEVKVLEYRNDFEDLINS